MSAYLIGTGAGGVGTAVVTTSLSFTFANAAASAPLDPIVLTNSFAPLYVQSQDLSSGLNTITVPTLAGGVVIIPPTANTATITLKGVTGDTGVALSKVAPTQLSFHTTPPANFVLTTGGAIAGVKFIWL